MPVISGAVPTPPGAVASWKLWVRRRSLQVGWVATHTEKMGVAAMCLATFGLHSPLGVLRDVRPQFSYFHPCI